MEALLPVTTLQSCSVVIGNFPKKAFMKLIFFSLLFNLFYFPLNAQNYSINFNVNIQNNEIKEVVQLWQSYLKSNSKNDWDENEAKNLKNFNILDMPRVKNPSFMNWGFNNRILSINRISDNSYLIKSISENDTKEVFAITNVVAKRINNTFKLSNYIFEYTKHWKIKQRQNINYIYDPNYNFNDDESLQAEKFYSHLCEIFRIKPEKLTYFIAKDCDNIYDIIGYDYIFSKGTSKECGYFESKNNFIFATEKAGANHYHEITHFINKFYPNANELLLTGISAYISEEKSHFGKPLIYHTKRVNEYLIKNNQIDLSKPYDFYKLDEFTNPQYVIGAILCDLILEKGGNKELINSFNNTKTDEELLEYFKSKILKKNENLNDKIRDKIKKISNLNDFPNKLKS